jgi:hypothetical protein
VARAVAARRAEAEALAGPIALDPLVRTDFPSEFLLGRNLVGGVVDGRVCPGHADRGEAQAGAGLRLGEAAEIRADHRGDLRVSSTARR